MAQKVRREVKFIAGDLDKIKEAFVSEFGEHAAANSETGRLLGFEPADETEPDAPEVTDG
jgi:hypothetical protein